MTPQQMLTHLIEQREKIDAAIAGVQGLVTGKRGRPSKAVMASRAIIENGKRKRGRPARPQPTSPQ